MRTLLSGVVAVSLISACGGTFRPKLREIEDTRDTAGNVDMQRSIIDYREGRISAVIMEDNGQPTERLEIIYTNDRIRTINYLDLLDSTVVAVRTLTHRNDRLAQVLDHWQDGTATRDTTTDFIYRDDRLDTVNEAGTYVTPPNTVTSSRRTEFDYDDEDRLSRMTEFVNDTTTLITFTYNENGLPQSVLETGTGSTFSSSFQYGEDDQLERVSSSASSYSVTYAEARIDQIVNSSSGYTRTTRYTYADGDVDGITPTPDVPWGQLFDMKGAALDFPEYESTAFLFGGD
jgi:hypothetical protein